MQNFFLITLNFLLISFFIFLSFNKNIKKSATSFSLLFYSIFYGLGFIILYLFSKEVFFNGIFFPNYYYSYAFPFPEKSERILHAMTVINICIFFSIKTSERLQLILKERHYYLDGLIGGVFKTTGRDAFLNGTFLCVIVLAYFILFFLEGFSWPIMLVLEKKSSISSAPIEWFSSQSLRPLFFYPSVMRQFLEIYAPLSILYFLAFYINNARVFFYKRVEKIFLFLCFCFFTFLLIGLLKVTPVFVFVIQVFLYLFFLKKASFKKSFFLLCFFISFIFINFHFRHFVNSEPIGVKSNSQEKPFYEKTKKESSLKKEYFETSKVKNISSKETIEEINDFNRLHYSKVSRVENFFPISVQRVLGRIFVGEIVDTYMVVGNKELSDFFKSENPYIGYLKKIEKLESKTIYEKMAAVLLGRDKNTGSISISSFYEFYLLFDVFCFLPILGVFIFLSFLDRYIYEAYSSQNYFVDPSSVVIIIVILKAIMKGFLTALFTGGGMSIIAWFLFKFFREYFFKKTIKIFF